jgi:hypothetical protein
MATNTPGLGIDISGTGDIDPMLSFSDGPRSVAEAVIVSFTHNPGALWWAPSRGVNVMHFLHEDNGPDEIQRMLQAQAEADERVQSADVVVSIVGKVINVECRLTLINKAGDVEFTLTVSEAGKVLSAAIN